MNDALPQATSYFFSNISSYHINSSNELNFDAQMFDLFPRRQVQGDGATDILRGLVGTQGRLDFELSRRIHNGSDSGQILGATIGMFDAPKGILVEFPTRIVIYGDNARIHVLLLRYEFDINLDTSSAGQGRKNTSLIINK
jgi:hypothetical protein